MAGETQLKDSGGATLLDTDGATAIHEDCCCIEYGEDCQYCDAGKTPKYITVTFSSIVALTCQDGVEWEDPPPNTDASGVVSASSGLVGVAILLTQVGGTVAGKCTWDVDVGSLTVKAYDEHGCNVGDLALTITDTFDVSLVRGNGTWSLTVVSNQPVSPPQLYIDVFSDTQSGDCGSVPNMTNDYTSSTPGDFVLDAITTQVIGTLFKNGTASLEFGDQT